ncbi:ABC transporter substrate-binding protein [Paeniglutamicibacter sp. Y32M11]|uniref:ABC transporter substrate-binding protein n=1 Tax=Paeniglutamicibacter sp. Y32M11 TaxID=2853258 RepID=UPI001C529FFC|nr:extracellular solute-binding protein [Paeniglutamicibacter sp. Y32M11]QXQ09905.1 extracellular solute-binding protein [Paeniglutamicibacter sp. Y32M11]
MKNRHIKRNFTLTLGLASVLLLTACGGDATASAGLGERDGVETAAALGGAEAQTNFEQQYAKALEAGQKSLNVYTPLTATWPDVFEAFQERFPNISVEPLQIVGAELDTKVSQEQSSGQRIADLVITGDVGAVSLADRGYFTEYRPANAKPVTEDPQFSLDTGTLTAVSASPRGLVYDTRQDLGITPDSWTDLLDPALKGKITMTDPATDGGGLQWADLVLNDEKLGEGYLKDLAAQDVVISSSTAECHNAVVQGRAYICVMGAMGNFMTLTKAGAPVEITYPIEGGNWATNWYAGVVNGAANAQAAELFVSWLNTPEANEVKAKAGHGPVANAEGLDLPFENPSEVPLLPRPDLVDVTDRQRQSQSKISAIFGR